MGALQERITSTKQGSITSIQAVRTSWWFNRSGNNFRAFRCNDSIIS
jgi:hypothetical protein